MGSRLCGVLLLNLVLFAAIGHAADQEHFRASLLNQQCHTDEPSVEVSADLNDSVVQQSYFDLELELRQLDDEIARLLARRKELRKRKRAGVLRRHLEDARRKWDYGYSAIHGIVSQWSKAEASIVDGKGWDRLKDNWEILGKKVYRSMQNQDAPQVLEEAKAMSKCFVEAIRGTLPDKDDILNALNYANDRLKIAVIAMWTKLPDRYLLHDGWQSTVKMVRRKARKWRKRIRKKSKFIYRGYVAPAGAFFWTRLYPRVVNVYRSIPHRKDIFRHVSNMWKRILMSKILEDSRSFFTGAFDLLHRESRDVVNLMYYFSRQKGAFIIERTHRVADSVALGVVEMYEKLVCAFRTALYRVKIFVGVFLVGAGLWLLSRLMLFLSCTYSVSHNILDFMKRIYDGIRGQPQEVEDRCQSLTVAENIVSAKNGDETVLYIPINKRPHNPGIRVRIMYEEDSSGIPGSAPEQENIPTAGGKDECMMSDQISHTVNLLEEASHPEKGEYSLSDDTEGHDYRRMKALLKNRSMILS